jgi:hypothetical protein
MLCERTLGILNASDLRDLEADHKTLLEALNYEGLVNAYAPREAQACARHFVSVRDGLFMTYPWVFARKIATLTSTTAVAGWRYAYSLPSDCVKLHQIVLKMGTTPKYEQYGNVVACNNANPSARYSAVVTNTAQWPMLFQDAFCGRLAQEIALSVTQFAELGGQAFEMFKFAINEGYRTGAIDPGIALDNNLVNATLNTTRLLNPTPGVAGAGSAADSDSTDRGR